MERQSPSLYETVETIAYRLHVRVESDTTITSDTRQELKQVLDSLSAAIKTEDMEELRDSITGLFERRQLVSAD